MKLTLRTAFLIAFAVLVALVLGASRVAHIFSRRALLEEELELCRKDLTAISANLEKHIEAGKEANGIRFFEEASKVESIGRWDCCYVLCDTAGIVVSPSHIAGKPLTFSVYQQRPDGIELGTFSDHKVAVLHCAVHGAPYVIFGLYEKDYLLGDTSYMEDSYRLILLVMVALLLLIAWVWVIPAVERVIERRRSAEQTLSLARDLQLKAVTQDFPSDDRVDTFAILQPMYEVGGDIYGCRMEGNKLHFVMGDVSGEGMEASFLMFMVSSLVQSGFKRGQQPAEIASSLNELIFDNRGYGLFCTLLLGTIDLDTREMEYCNAGHTKSLLDGNFLPQMSNFVLGGFPGFVYRSQKITLAHGSRLVFYTDGVTEARNKDKEFFGEDALLRWASQPSGNARQCCESLLNEVYAFRGNAPQNDDIAIMTIQIL
ncbi:MAG: serine/threonine-protein phosphatase [Bacteroidales bacterium]|nr:serine/threonine-protein phosphatase [Bacteroidales bacterium]